MSKYRQITAREIIKALYQEGFIQTRAKGSHFIFRHPDGRRVVVAFHHPADTFPPKTLKAIIKDTGWDGDDLRRLKLIF